MPSKLPLAAGPSSRDKAPHRKAVTLFNAFATASFRACFGQPSHIYYRLGIAANYLVPQIGTFLVRSDTSSYTSLPLLGYVTPSTVKANRVRGSCKSRTPRHIQYDWPFEIQSKRKFSFQRRGSDLQNPYLFSYCTTCLPINNFIVGNICLLLSKSGGCKTICSILSLAQNFPVKKPKKRRYHIPIISISGGIRHRKILIIEK